MTTARHPEAGVTLIEVLVALVLFALIAGAGFTMLDQVVRVQTLTEGRLQKLAQVQRAMLVVTRDFMQASGQSLDFADAAVSFRRSAADGEMAVRYDLENGVLVRSISGGGGAEARQAILSDVDALDWRFLGPDRAWTDAWPPRTSRDQTRANPAAVALGVRLAGATPSGELRRVAILPAESGQ